jgi:hypothetical protein
VTTFAYGQTASGKTFTMMGTDEKPGIIRLSMQTVFDYIKQNTTESRMFLIRVSYLEIYNEKVFDLLSKELRTVNIFVDKNKNISFDNLKEEVVRDVDEVMDIIKRGESFRTVAKTFANDTSSRSHTVFRMVIERKDELTVNDGTSVPKKKTVVRIGQLNLVDLAGSENASKHESNDRAREGKNINLSLLHLKEIIMKLSKGKKVESFRNSKLTRILGQSLGGNAKVAVICAINPILENYGESKQTLYFGNCAGMITVAPTVNSDGTNAMIIKYQQEITAMQQEVAYLKEKLSRYDHTAMLDGVQDIEIQNKNIDKRRSIKVEMGELQHNMDELNKFIITNQSLEARIRDQESEKEERENRLKLMEEERVELEKLLRQEAEERKMREMEVDQERGEKQALGVELASMNQNLPVMYQLLQQEFEQMEKERAKESQDMNETVAKLYQTLLTKDDEIKTLKRLLKDQQEHSALVEQRCNKLDHKLEKALQELGHFKQAPRRAPKSASHKRRDEEESEIIRKPVRSVQRHIEYSDEEEDMHVDERRSRHAGVSRGDVAKGNRM